MNAPKPSGTAMTNTTKGSIARIQHSEPSVRLLGRIAGKDIGKLGLWGSGGKPDLHFTLLISDAYSGTLGFDGQPTADLHISRQHPKLLPALSNVLLIKTNIYQNEIPKGVVVEIDVDPPTGMSNTFFAQKLAQNAYAFASYVLDYNFPKNLVEPVMVEGNYNSSSYIAGLLNSVMGFTPAISTPGYQTPGWETPIPASYFKGEAIK